MCESYLVGEMIFEFCPTGSILSVFENFLNRFQMRKQIPSSTLAKTRPKYSLHDIPGRCHRLSVAVRRNRSAKICVLRREFNFERRICEARKIRLRAPGRE